MSVTWSAVTAMKPDKAVLVRATGLLLDHAMGLTVPVEVEASSEPCWVRFGGAFRRTPTVGTWHIRGG